MQEFSKRNNIVTTVLNLESVSMQFNIRILDTFINYAKKHIWSFLIKDSHISYIEEVMAELGHLYEIPRSEFDNDKNASNLRKYLTDCNNLQWYDIYDFIEKSLYVVKYDEKLLNDYNRIMEEEGILYRIFNNQVVPIIDNNQIKSIEDALSTKYDSINKHLSNALEYISKRKNPQNSNSIKESISAVESLCSVLTKTTGKTATLGNMLDLLEKEGIYIHKALIEAFKKIYGYTSDEGGIRHGSGFEKDAKLEDARYMLVSCSAFINYIMEKTKNTNLEQ